MVEFFLKLRHNKQLLGFAVAFSLLFVVVVMGVGVFYFYQFSQQVTVNEEVPTLNVNNVDHTDEGDIEQAVDSVYVADDALARLTERGSILYLKVDSAKSEQGYGTSVGILNTKTDDIYNIVEFNTGGYISNMQRAGGVLFYLQDSNLQSLDLSTKEIKTIMSSTTDIMVVEDRLWYVIDESMLSGPYNIGYIDLNANQSQIVAKDVGRNFNMSPGGLVMYTYNSTDSSLSFYSQYGDAGCGSIGVYKLDINTGQISEVDSGSFCACGIEDFPDRPCTPEAKVQEAHFDQVRKTVSKSQRVVCGGEILSFNFANGDPEFTIYNDLSQFRAKYITCIE
jgi:hypothetical protein